MSCGLDCGYEWDEIGHRCWKRHDHETPHQCCCLCETEGDGLLARPFTRISVEEARRMRRP